MQIKSPNRPRMLVLQSMTFRHKKDFNAHRLLRSIDKNCLLSKLSKDEEALETDRFLSYDELKEMYADFPDLWINTEKLLSNCQLKFQFDEDAEPQNVSTYTGSKKEDLELIKQLSIEGIAYRYPEATDLIYERMNKEIDIIAQKDYLSYFLITWDFTSYARSKGYFYVGRGSGANSIVAYLLRITDVDPLELNPLLRAFHQFIQKKPTRF